MNDNFKKELEVVFISIMIFFLWNCFIYVCTSFLFLELNPKLWSFNTRYFMASVGFLIGAIWTICYLVFSKMD